jgi:iron complex outermembrane recepter protein
MKKSGLLVAGSAISFVLCASVPAYAQSASEEKAEEEVSVDEEKKTESEKEEGILVTGSRLKQNTYSSISPLQVIKNEDAQDTGVFDAATVLQRSEAAAGTQIDATFGGFVLDNGPGSQTINLRGLGADRTLLLINGRRMAPAGVEGAPTNPSINLLPSSLVDRYDLLTDGASSIYGSDAIAGVVNVILRKNFDGLTLFASGDINPQGAGEDYQISGSWGINNDRGFLGIGAEYTYRDAVRLSDRSFFRGCDKHYEVDQNGNFHSLGVTDNATVRNRTPGVRVSESECKITGLSGRVNVQDATFGSVYFTNGRSNTGIPNFSENTFRGVDLDRNGDGIRDVDFQNYNTNAAEPDVVFINEQKLINVMAYGEYVLEGAANITPFFEFNYSRAESATDNSGHPQIFPFVPSTNAFNPCNRSAVGGVDCRAAQNANFGPPLLSTGFDLSVQPIFSVRGDRNNFDVVQEQYRGVLGLKGALPFIGSSWDFEVSGVYSKAIGKSTRLGVREDKLAFALGLDPTADYNRDGVVDNNRDGIADDYNGNVQTGPIYGDNLRLAAPCSAAGLRNPSLAAPDLTQGCVPVNLFASSLLGQPIGDFATQAERSYLFGERSFNTTYEQLLLSAFAGGSIFSLAGGDATLGVGLEYRKDKINSKASTVAANGLLFGFFADQGAVGSKDIKEAFGELSLPLKAGETLVRELTLNISGRYTDEEFYGQAGTYSIKGLWRPVDALALKFSYGTSFRAPNLRENFLKGQTGFLTLSDPCAVPDAAEVSGVYVASLDIRDPNTLANCRREGRDPTRVGLDSLVGNTITTTSAEIVSGGSLDLNEETSRAITTGFAFDQTFGGGFDVQLAGNYYDIKVKGAVVEPSSQFILNDCYTRQDGQRSPFCDRIGVSGIGRLLVNSVSAGFINLNQESVRGLDFNADFGKEVKLFGTNVDLGLNLRANHLIERSTLLIDNFGAVTRDDDDGEFGLPKWTGQATFTADIDKFRFTWQVDYTGPVEQQADGIDRLADFLGRGPDGAATGFISDTCLGNGTTNPNGTVRVAGDGLFCRDVGFAGKYFTHAASIRYRDDNWTIRAGITNLFNRKPPQVDSNEVFAIANTAVGNGYDYDGREFFFSVQRKF